MLTFDGMAFLPTVTAAIVGARLASTLDMNRKTITDHVIVVGLGNVGTRIVGQLHDLGVRVICVDKNPNAQGVPMARRLGVPVVTGQVSRDETLREAGIDTCRSLVSVASKDEFNLETALHARSLREDLRVVVRLFDNELAERLEKTLGGNVVSRSVSYLAAPSFAVAMLEHQVLRTIPVGRHVLLIADVPVDPGSELEGAPLEQVHEAGQARVIALRRRGVDEMDWKPHQGYLLSAQDRMIVLATRAGTRPGTRAKHAERAATSRSALTVRVGLRPTERAGSHILPGIRAWRTEVSKVAIWTPHQSCWQSYKYQVPWPVLLIVHQLKEGH